MHSALDVLHELNRQLKVGIRMTNNHTDKQALIAVKGAVVRTIHVMNIRDEMEERLHNNIMDDIKHD